MQLTTFLRDRASVLDAVYLKRKSPDLLSAVLARASELAGECKSGSLARQTEIVTALVRRITVAQGHVKIEIDRKALAERLIGKEGLFTSEAQNRRPILIEVLVRFRRRGIEAKFVILDQQQPAAAPDANLVKALARAHKWFGRIVRGEASGIGDIAHAERLDRSYVTRVLCLAFLAPEITKAILEGRQRD